MSIPEWHAACEKLLDALTSDRVDFDVDDAIRDLAALGIIQCDDLGWSALPFILAVEARQKRWNDIKNDFTNHWWNLIKRRRIDGKETN